MTRESQDISNCTCGSLRKATRAVTQAYDVALQPVGLKSTQLSLLGALSRLGSPQLTELAEVLVMDRTTLSRNLKPLIKKGLILIGSDEDQRISRIQLTEEGKGVLYEAEQKWSEIQKKLVERLGEDRWSQLLDDLALTTELIKQP